jgi:hypothetical protein
MLLYRFIKNKTMKKSMVRFVKENLTLEITIDGKLMYEVDLEKCDDSAEILDYILQIHDKTWSTPELVCELLDALNFASEQVHGEPIQGVYCSFGASKQVPWKK